MRTLQPARPTAAVRSAADRRAGKRPLALVGRLGIAVGLIGVVLLGLWATVALSGVSPGDTSGSQVPPASVRAGTAVPAVPAVQPPADQAEVGDWAQQQTSIVKVPARALRAYAAADLAMRVEVPGCRVSWATLAGIGRVESNHGRFGGAVLGADGRPSRAILGVPLNGSRGVAAIPDTDRGRLDGDTEFDRAVGPMQFIPTTWARWGADGDGDGQADPQDIDDAALSAARYLCADGQDMRTPRGWWARVLSYNHSVEYGQRVFTVADTYARAGAR